MESQFGIAHVWAQGDFVTRGVAILLLLMSVASWVVIIVKALGLMKYKKYANEAVGCSDRTHCLKAVRPQVRRTALQPWVRPVLERVAQVVQYLPRVQIHFPACLWGHQVQAWGLQSP